MKHSGFKPWPLLAMASMGIVGTSARADDAALEKKVADLSAEVADLRAQQAKNGKDAAVAIDAVLRDAEQRSQLLATSGDTSAGYDNGFFIRSGDFLLRPGISIQFRNVTDYRQHTGGANDDEVENGFEIRRLQFSLEGTAYSKDLSYFFQWDVNRGTSSSDAKDSDGNKIGSVDVKSGGNAFLEDAWVKYTFADNWAVRAGQFKDPVTHEKILSDKRLVAVERSLQDAVLGGGYLDRTQGLSLIYGGYDPNNPLYAELALTDGANQLNTSYLKAAFDFGIAGRAEYKIIGNWKDYADLSARGTKQDLFVIGGGFDWSQSGDGNSIVGALDADYENPSGLALFGSAIVRNRDSGLTGTDDQTDWSLLGQVSYALSPPWEIFGRYTYLNFDSPIATAGDEDTFHEITVGVVYYLGKNGSAGNRAKITLDINWLPNGAPATLTAPGYLGDSGGESEIVLRGQFQLSI